MKVALDSARCQGHGRCYDLAPQVFDEDEEGYAQVRGDGTVSADDHRVATLAVRNCPENAIALIEEPALEEVTS